MTPNEYQQLAKRTLIDAPEVSLTDLEVMQVWCAVGLAGEAGEILEHIKKAVFHRHGFDTNRTLEIKDELGDLCWYLAGLATKLDLTLEEIMQHNVDKLRKRYPNGFNSEDSKNRK